MAFNLTRAAGTLAGGQFAKATTGTIRTKIINVAARTASSTRRIRLRLPGNWPWQDSWEKLFDTISRRPNRPEPCQSSRNGATERNSETPPDSEVLVIHPAPGPKTRLNQNPTISDSRPVDSGLGFLCVRSQHVDQPLRSAPGVARHLAQSGCAIQVRQSHHLITALHVRNRSFAPDKVWPKPYGPLSTAAGHPLLVHQTLDLPPKGKVQSWVSTSSNSQPPGPPVRCREDLWRFLCLRQYRILIWPSSVPAVALSPPLSVQRTLENGLSW